MKKILILISVIGVNTILIFNIISSMNSLPKTPAKIINLNSNTTNLYADDGRIIKDVPINKISAYGSGWYTQPLIERQKINEPLTIQQQVENILKQNNLILEEGIRPDNNPLSLFHIMKSEERHSSIFRIVLNPNNKTLAIESLQQWWTTKITSSNYDDDLIDIKIDNKNYETSSIKNFWEDKINNNVLTYNGIKLFEEIANSKMVIIKYKLLINSHYDIYQDKIINNYKNEIEIYDKKFKNEFKIIWQLCCLYQKLGYKF